MKMVFARVSSSSPLSVCSSPHLAKPFPVICDATKNAAKNYAKLRKTDRKMQNIRCKISFQKSSDLSKFLKISNFGKNSAKFWKNAVNSTSRQNLVKVNISKIV